MTRMFDRPSLQANQIRQGVNPVHIYTGWADENFYIAFKLTGISQSTSRVSRNFVDYQFRRAWGEDLCQILIQAVYADGSSGPPLQVVCKPNGVAEPERKMDPRLYANPWQPLQGAGIRYATAAPEQDWYGEVAIPWGAINEPGKKLPVMLRFNFAQHVQDTGESTSWAGPVDFGRDDAFTGILVLREPQTPGMLRAAQNQP